MYIVNDYIPVVRCMCGRKHLLIRAIRCECGATLRVSRWRKRRSWYYPHEFIAANYNPAAQPYKRPTALGWIKTVTV